MSIDYSLKCFKNPKNPNFCLTWIFFLLRRRHLCHLPSRLLQLQSFSPALNYKLESAYVHYTMNDFPFSRLFPTLLCFCISLLLYLRVYDEGNRALAATGTTRRYCFAILVFYLLCVAFICWTHGNGFPCLAMCLKSHGSGGDFPRHRHPMMTA